MVKTIVMHSEIAPAPICFSELQSLRRRRLKVETCIYIICSNQKLKSQSPICATVITSVRRMKRKQCDALSLTLFSPTMSASYGVSASSRLPQNCTPVSYLQLLMSWRGCRMAAAILDETICTHRSDWPSRN